MHDFSEYKRNILHQHLKDHLEGEVRFDRLSQELYSTDASIYQVMPIGVIIPRTMNDLHSAVQIALETRTPIIPRGGGTSLSGQSIGPGVVIDCSKYLNQIGPVDLDNKRVRLQPGVVLDQLNRAVNRYGLQFGPDVATANRATLGGMVGNNSAGSRSVAYGKTIDHVLRLQMILSDGKIYEIEKQKVEKWRSASQQSGLIGDIYRTVQTEVANNEIEISQRFPKIIRRVSGYNLGAYVENHPARYSLLPLLIGSEGTLGFIQEIEVQLIEKPKYRGLLVPHFHSLRAALDAVELCLQFQPSAVELLDTLLIQLASKQRALKETMSQIKGNPAALLMVELSSNDEKELNDRLDKLSVRLGTQQGVIAQVRATDEPQREPLWQFRSSAVPLLHAIPGKRKPITFVEDTAVAPEKLPEFASQFRNILQKHGTDGAFYGHASVGCLHIRPLLDLRNHDDIATMLALMEEITDLVIAYGGSLSGEHGDGMVRSPWNRKMFGDTIYQSFQRIKQTFDPNRLFNPGKIVDAEPVTEHWRINPETATISVPTLFDYEKQEGFFSSIEVCNGAGVCRKTIGGNMCPSYRATRDEKDSTRGRANALRIALSVNDPQAIFPANPSPQNTSRNVSPINNSENQNTANGRLSMPVQNKLHEVLDLCLSCKACKSECPSSVDMAKLKAEFLNHYHQRKRRSLRDYLVKEIPYLHPLAARFAPLVNLAQRTPSLRWVIDHFLRIHRSRELPEFRRYHFRRWFAERTPNYHPSGTPTILLLADCFTTYQEPNIGRSAVLLLESLGYRIQLLNFTCCARTMLSKGFLKEAKQLIEEQIPKIMDQFKEGFVILGLEPSCVVSLIDEWAELVPCPETSTIRSRTFLLEDWLIQQNHPKPLSFSSSSSSENGIQSLVLHPHCHQRAMIGIRNTQQLLKTIPSIQCTTLDAGCCGLAGSFGYESEHYPISVQIANLGILPALLEHPDAKIMAPGTSCRQQIRDLALREAYHPVEILWELTQNN